MALTVRRAPLVAVLALPALVLVAAAGTASPARAEEGRYATVCTVLSEQATAQPAAVGMVFVDLRNGDGCTVNATEVFRTASLYKLIVMAEAYARRDLGEFAFEEPLVLEERHYADDSPEAVPEEPLEITAGEAVRRMIEFSENASALALIERLGPAVIAGAPRDLGLTGTSLWGLWTTTPADIAHLFAALYRGELVSPQASAEMLDLLRGQQLNDLIPAALPEGLAIAHKTGLVGHYLHDAGVVFTAEGDYLLVLLTQWPERIEQSYRTIDYLAALTHAAFTDPAAVAALLWPLPDVRGAVPEQAVPLVAPPALPPSAAAAPPASTAVAAPSTPAPAVSAPATPATVAAGDEAASLGASAGETRRVPARPLWVGGAALLLASALALWLGAVVRRRRRGARPA